MSIWNDQNLIKTLQSNGVVVMPTDTLYGVIGRAENPEVVERIYKIRKRDEKKPCIVLVGDVIELKKFGIVLTEIQKDEIKKFQEKYQEPTSFIVDCPDEKFAYLHRGTKALAFRLPLSQDLQKFLLQTGPLVAPSANIEALLPAQTTLEAKKYFGDQVDLYVDGGIIKGKASKIIKLSKDGSVTVIRE